MDFYYEFNYFLGIKDVVVKIVEKVFIFMDFYNVVGRDKLEIIV